MDTQNDIAYYYRRAAEARARGREVLAQSMENYARNLEAGIYNDDGHGINMDDWEKKEIPQQQATTRRSNEDALYEKARPVVAPVAKPQKSYSQAPQLSGYGPGYTEPLEYEAPKTGPGYTEPPMDYPVVPKGGYGSYNPAPQQAPKATKTGPGYSEPPMDYPEVPKGGYASYNPAPPAPAKTGPGYTEPPMDYPEVTPARPESKTAFNVTPSDNVDYKNSLYRSYSKLFGGNSPLRAEKHGGGGGSYGYEVADLATPEYWQEVAKVATASKKAKTGPGYTEPPMDYAAPVIDRRSLGRESVENGLYELFPQSNGGFAEWPSKFPSKVTSTNSVADFRRRDEAAGYAPKQSGIPEFVLPPMIVTADAPRAQKPVPKLKGQAPSGGTPLTNYYAGQLKDTPHEANEGYNGIQYGSSGLVNRMRDLCRLVPYDEADGTNCARTISAALDGTPYSGFYNVDQFVDVAARNGQLRDANSGYKPKAGDLAVTNNGNHVVMVTENGGTIQNGKSRNGVYETDQKPSEQKGGAQYYITTSDYSDLYPSFHFDPGLAKNNLFDGR